MRRATRGLAAVALVALAALAGGGGAAAHNATPKHVQPHRATTPKRVLIVLFDQMLPGVRRPGSTCRTSSACGTPARTSSTAYLGYMASETVIAHNVITSGQAPEAHGMGRRGVSRRGQSAGRRRRHMRITGDLSSPSSARSSTDEGYPKLADYLHAQFPGTKFITVGEKSYAVESATAPSGDIAVRLSSRQSDTSAATGCANLGGQVAVPVRQERAGVPHASRSVGASTSTRTRRTTTRPPRRLPVVDVPRGRQPVLPRHDHRQGGTSAATPGRPTRRSKMMEQRGLVGHVRHDGSDRQGRRTCGAPDHDRQSPPGSADVPDPRALRRARTPTVQLGKMLDKLRQLDARAAATRWSC